MGFRRLPAKVLKVDGRETSLRVYEASTFVARACGLLGSDRLQAHEALWIRPCGSVHTIGMRYPIDVLFLDRQQRVVGVSEHLRPLRFAANGRAHSTLELLAGMAATAGIRRGSQLEQVSASSVSA
jgi:uncharacterized membrane protein (UPF0127 family)